VRQALFALAEKLGHHDPEALGAVMPSRALLEWVAFWKLQSDAVKSPSQE
jgi:hypothetical protein